jgi:hypothetical protein
VQKRSFDPKKPLYQLRRFASALGWHGLIICQYEFSDWEPPLITTWYQTTDRKFCLQINEHPQGQEETYAAAVYGYRYGLFSGFHRFTLYADERVLREVEQLEGWLQRRRFKNRLWRRWFRERYPECFRGRRGSVPWRPDDPKPPLNPHGDLRAPRQRWQQLLK